MIDREAVLVREKPANARNEISADSELRISDTEFFRRTLIVMSLVLVTGLLLAMIWYASDVFLLLFGGILVAVLLRAPTNWLARKTALSERVALILSILTLAAVLALLVYLFAAPLAAQAGQLAQTLPRAMATLREWINENQWTRPLRPLFAELARMRPDIQLLGRATGVISSTLQGLGAAVVVLFIGIYLAAQPRVYQRGFMHLLPWKARPRACEVLDEIGRILRRWLLGRLATMSVIGFSAGLGLWLLDVPLAFTLGVMSGLLEFIPFLGPVLAAVPALLIAFNINPTLAFYVLLLYVGIQTAENYLLSPLIEHRSVSLPPAMVIFATLLLGALAGGLGVVLASPLTAAGVVAIKLLYVEDVVEQPLDR